MSLLEIQYPNMTRNVPLHVFCECFTRKKGKEKGREGGETKGGSGREGRSGSGGKKGVGND